LLQEAGAYAVVLEKIPSALAKTVSQQLQIPTIGIGAGADCDGQVLVMHDMLGINTEFKPRFLRQYLHLHEQITGAVQQYIKDVKTQDFPNDAESY
jgi:3-methyl-2-oxobutanoate hydroxymethyltransferase